MLISDLSRKIYNDVFRKNTSHPGFYIQDFGNEIDSNFFRQKMINLKNDLSKICGVEQKKCLVYQSLGRFNHQHSSMFHKDTADAPSFLMLGYEPTNIESKVRIADFDRYIEQKEIVDGMEMGDAHSIELVHGETIPKKFVTEIMDFHKENYRILVLNNCKYLGVFHSAEMGHVDDDEYRIINYLMMYLCDHNTEERYTKNEIENYIFTDNVSL